MNNVYEECEGRWRVKRSSRKEILKEKEGNMCDYELGRVKAAN
jgi:hypothetical protein